MCVAFLGRKLHVSESWSFLPASHYLKIRELVGIALFWSTGLKGSQVGRGAEGVWHLCREPGPAEGWCAPRTGMTGASTTGCADSGLDLLGQMSGPLPVPLTGLLCRPHGKPQRASWIVTKEETVPFCFLK